MANLEHLQLVRRGADVWHAWRDTHHRVPEIDLSMANLSGVNLSGMNLTGANLRLTDLSRAHLSRTNLRGADLSNAGLSLANLGLANLSDARFIQSNLIDAYLREANLRGTDFTGARLLGADLSSASLVDTNFSSANLRGANFSDANLRGVNLTQSTVGRTVFASVDLREVKGLETIQHYGPSEISISTLLRSEGQIPEIFLRGCGLRDWEIETTKIYLTDLSKDQIVDLTYKIIELRTDPFIQFNSCFISYSSWDQQFAQQLYMDLQESGVRCWFAPEDMTIGDKIRHKIDDSILLHDKLLLVLSRTSVESEWIEQEVESALRKEREQGYEVLFPIRLDDEVMHIQSGWPALINNTRHIGDFSQWATPYEYEKAFAGLLSDLRTWNVRRRDYVQDGFA
jgi:uncharacterized protein YjbI with pentapeptide repeats